MRKLSLFALCLLTFAVQSVAQDKVESKWNCSKASDSKTFAVPDAPNHSYVLGQGNCTAASSTSGEKTGTYTEFMDMSKDKFTNHGRFVTTADSGDKLIYSYDGSGSTDAKKPSSNKWKIVDGTGKKKGMKASGTCSGQRHDDGSSDWTCTGTSTAAK